MGKQTAIILANVGTPGTPTISAVYSYLTEFLNDPRVIDLPWLARKILVNFIIIPFRVRNSTRLYASLWDEKGSPLLYHTQSLAEKLEKHLGKGAKVYVAMRYGQPRLKDVLDELRRMDHDEIIILPMFPQYASSTTGTASEEILKSISSWNEIPRIHILNQFYDHPAYLKAFARAARQYAISEYDHVLFSFHGLPESHIQRIHPENKISDCDCEREIPKFGQLCYRATCFATARNLAKELNIPTHKYSVGFQSRLSKNWLTPFSDQLIRDLGKAGKKSLLVFAPSFVTDCLETIIEIGHEYKDIFRANGGQTLHLAEALNDSDEWVYAISDILGHSS